MSTRGISNRDGEVFGYLAGKQVYDLQGEKTGVLDGRVVYDLDGGRQWLLDGDALTDLKGNVIGYLGAPVADEEGRDLL
ncbi:4-fold beta flower protein [Aggregatilinea lenta]|uniref:4-fold beta flower protein n=1 Tax=Aggregatilinea lenta TaxID=913108 RepID=UPI000E5B57D4|nr:hypothetical protein [Aggregatilinea lenta]